MFEIYLLELRIVWPEEGLVDHLGTGEDLDSWGTRLLVFKIHGTFSRLVSQIPQIPVFHFGWSRKSRWVFVSWGADYGFWIFLMTWRF